jgi:hypothetical protein
MYSESTIKHFIWRYKNLPPEDNKTPRYMYDMVEHYLNTDGHIKNIKAFRGSGKSINTCILALERVATGRDRFVMIVSDTATQSEALIADIQTLINDGNNNIEVTRSITGSIEFNVNGKPACIMGVGAGMSLRGRKFKRMRPTLVITDDLMNDSVALNRLRMDRLSRWFYKVLLPSMNPSSELWNVGTPLNAGDIFMKLCSLHPTLEIPLSEGVWTDRFSDEWIANKKAEYQAAGMLREYNQEFSLVLTDSDTRLFDTSKITFIDYIPTDVSWYLSCDLAFSSESTADYSALVVLGIDAQGSIYCAPYQMRGKPSEVANHIYTLVSQYQILDVGIEQGASFIAIVEHLETLMQDYNNYFNINELKHGGKSKHSRISSLEPLVNSRRLTVIDMPDMASEELIEQMELTDHITCAASHDDLIDGLSYISQLNMVYSYKGEDLSRQDYQQMFSKRGKRRNVYD